MPGGKEQTTTAQSKVFSRCKIVIDCIKKQQKSKSVTKEEILVQFDKIFWNKNGNKAIFIFQNLL